jgi:AraC family transcriptional regulator
MLRVTDYAANSAMRPHLHDEASIIVVLKGNYVERIAGSDADHTAGHILWYPAGTLHSQIFGSAGARKVVLSPDNNVLEYLAAHGHSLTAPAYFQSPGALVLARRIASEIRNDDPYTALARDGLSLELVALVARERNARRTARAPAWLRAAREMVCEPGDDRLTLRSIADEVGRHPVHVAREFRRYYGTSIGSYRRAVQLDRAEAMLASHMGLNEIALSCGFASHAHFSRVFKASRGVSPSEYRRDFT